MTLARVRGTVVAELRADALVGPRYLLVEECGADGTGRGEYHVVLDPVGAERGQLVLVAQGSSCRWTLGTADKPMDALLVGIVDMIDVRGEPTWDEARREA